MKVAMRIRSARNLVLAGFAALGLSLGAGWTQAIQKPVDPKAAEFFEAKIRPILVDKCSSCHGSSMQQGGIRLDTLEFALKGNSNGVPIVPGEPERSLIVKVI